MSNFVIWNENEIESYISQVQKFTSEPNLAHTRRYLGALGIEEAKLKSKIIHVAGTNGKGSVCNYLYCLLQEKGHSVGMFTSPHLVSMRERIAINGEMISEDDFSEAFVKVKEVVETHKHEKDWFHPTFFEFLFLMAMVYYQKKAPEYLILETGLGGLLDATNVFRYPVLTIITEIGLDHCAYLGNTFSEVATQKAGIIKDNVPLVFANKREESTCVILQQARKCQAKTVVIDKNVAKVENIAHKGIDFSFISRYYNNISLHLNKIAPYQVENVAIALSAFEELFEMEDISIEMMQNAILKANWPGRMEEILPDVFLDGAHNEDGIQAFLESVSVDNTKGDRILIFSVVSDKAYYDMIGGIVSSGLFGKYIIAGLQDKRGTAISELQDVFENCQILKENVIGKQTVREALQEGLKLRKQNDRVYVAGSLYLVGEIRRLLMEDRL